MSDVSVILQGACDLLNKEIDAQNEGVPKKDQAKHVDVHQMVRRFLAAEFYLPLMTGTFFSGLTSDKTSEVTAVIRKARELRQYRDTLETFRKQYDERLAAIPEEVIPKDASGKASVVHIRQPRKSEDVDTVNLAMFD